MTKENELFVNRAKRLPRAVKLLVSGWSLLQAHEHRRLEQKTLAAYTGLTETTLSNWTVGATDLSQIEALLRLLERLPQAARASLVINFLRICPSFASSQLAHDPVAVDGLRAILQHTRGLTFIQGPEDGLRTFVLTALGHEATHVDAGCHYGRVKESPAQETSNC